MQKKLAICDECESEFFKEVSPMATLCPNCSHLLYGYNNCDHQFHHGKCQKCGWHGNISEFLRKKSENF